MEAQVFISVFLMISGFLISYLTFVTLRHKDIKHDAAELATISVKLDNISFGIENICVDLKAQEKRVSELSERLIRVEESVKQAHKRLDNYLLKKGEKIENHD